MIDKKCPKCGSKSFVIHDHCEVYYIYDVNNGVVTADGMGDDGGNRSKVVCECTKCGHVWRPRKVEFDIDKG